MKDLFTVLVVAAAAWYFLVGKEAAVAVYDLGPLHQNLYETCVANNPSYEKYFSCKRSAMNKLADPAKYAANDKKHIDSVIGTATRACS